MTSRPALGGPGGPGEPVSADSLPGSFPGPLSGPQAIAEACGVPIEPGWLVIADELPDGLVVADEAGRVAVFNATAARLTNVHAADALGKDLFDVLPLCDADGRDWWACTDPYHGLQIRTRHPERPLYLRDGTEVLVVVRYVRERRRHDVLRLVVALHDAAQRVRVRRIAVRLAIALPNPDPAYTQPLRAEQSATATLRNHQ